MAMGYAQKAALIQWAFKTDPDKLTEDEWIEAEARLMWLSRIDGIQGLLGFKWHSGT